MLARLRTATVFGVEACQVDVEVDVSFGMPRFTMVGLPDASVRESRDRVRSAIRNSGFAFPTHRITVNLAPADVRKAGAAFDLPIALGILAAEGIVERRDAHELMFLGELSLDGSIHPARGVLPIAAAARRAGIAALLLPAANAREAAIVGGLDVYPVTSLADAVRTLNDPSLAPSRPAPLPPISQSVADLADIRGQLLARRALEIACAGGHNLIAVGPPGSGKTMMARRVPGILPPLTFDEAVEVTSVHSVAGLLPPGSGLVSQRPFRAPHHTISDIALIGGGSQPRPGEVSLAHNGVLFLDEMLEFNRRVLEVLRQPLEERAVTIARAARTAVFPAQFMLVGAMNPCPCGYLGDALRECRCTPQQVARYRDRLSGPLRDRLDLVVDVPALPVETLTTDAHGEASVVVRQRVVDARGRQRDRYAGGGIRTNAELTPSLAARHCFLDGGGIRLIRSAVTRLGLSARGFDRVRAVARTIADLDSADDIDADHLAEALQFRPI
jgi:magnesium chelatase family protein